MLIELRRSLLPLCVLVLAAACGGDSSGPPAVATVDVSAPSGDVIVGQTTQLGATPRDANGNALSGRTVAWSSSNNAVATVSGSGLVTGVTPGSATITATIEGKAGSRSVSVIPVPVASVEVTAASSTVQVGQTTQATAITRDASNNVLTGRVVTWTSSDQTIASVSSSGVVLGVAAGIVTITATSESKTGSTQITITSTNPADAPQIAAITPSTIVEGQPATITGAKFAPSIAGNVVRVGGVPAAVTSASETTLQIVVPTLNCKPPQNIAVDVTANGLSSAAKSQPFAPKSTFSLQQGKQQIIKSAAEFCLQLPATGASESYLIGLQSVSEAVSSLTPALVAAEAGSGAIVSAPLVTPAPRQTLASLFADPTQTARAQRLARHRAAEAQVVAAERTMLASRPWTRSALARTSRSSSGASAASVPTVPSTVKVGDVITVRVPDRTKAFCTEFFSVESTVKAIGTYGIIIADNANPDGGYTDADYQAMSATFDSQVYPTDVDYFGTPPDDDGNGRIVIMITKEVNKTDNLLGVVYNANFLPQSQCPPSNEGEFFYGRAPDPNASAGQKYEVDKAREDAPVIIAHELVHVIQIGRRVADPNATVLQSTWELEGQATFGEEVNGYAATGRAPGQNLGFAVAFSPSDATTPAWFSDPFADLAVYYGFETRDTRVANAPEQCSWLGLEVQGNTGPCLSGREVYGVPWSLLRWISDQYGSTFAGGEKELHRRFIDNGQMSGFANLTNVVGQPINTMLAQWSASLYADDRVPGIDPRLTLTSWNLVDIESGLVATARLAPRTHQFTAFMDPISVRGGSTAYFVVSGAGRPAIAIRARDATDGQLSSVMQMWVVRMQ